MLGKFYALQHVEVSIVDDKTVTFRCDRPFAILDSVVIEAPAVSPLNTQLLTLTRNNILPALGYVDISQYVVPPGQYVYKRLPTVPENDERQFVIVLCKIS